MEILAIGGRQNEAVLRRHCPSEHRLDLVPITSLFAGWDGTSLVLVRSDTKRPVESYDAVYLMGWGQYSSMARLVAFFVAKKGIPAMNVQLLDTWPVTKVAELCRLTAAGVTHPKTVCTQLSENMPQLAKWAEAKLGFQLPVVVKAIGGARGETNFKVNPGEDLILPDRWRMYLVQEYIPNRGDWRIVIMGGKPVVAIWRERQNEETHLNNTSKGGKATVVDLRKVDPAVLAISVRAAEAMGRTDLAGVDVMVHADTGRPYVLEVNLCPDIVLGSPDESDVTVKLAAVFEELGRRAGGAKIVQKADFSADRAVPGR